MAAGAPGSALDSQDAPAAGAGPAGSDPIISPAETGRYLLKISSESNNTEKINVDRDFAHMASSPPENEYVARALSGVSPMTPEDRRALESKFIEDLRKKWKLDAASRAKRESEVASPSQQRLSVLRRNTADEELIETLRKQVEQAKKNADEMESSLRARFEETLSAKEDEINALRDEAQRVRSASGQFTEGMLEHLQEKALKKRRSVFSKDKAKKKKEFYEDMVTRAEAAAMTAQEWKERLDSESTARWEATEKADQLRDQVIVLEEALAHHKTSELDARHLYESEARKVQELEKKVFLLSVEADEAAAENGGQQQSEEVRNRRRSVVEGYVAELEQSLANNLGETEELKSHFKAEHDRLTSQVTRLRRMMEDYESKEGAAGGDGAFIKRLHELEEEKDDLETRLDVVSKEKEDLARKFDDLQAAHENMEDAFRDMSNSEYNNLLNQERNQVQSVANRKIEELTEFTSTLETKVAELEDEVVDLNKKLEEKAREVVSHQEAQIKMAEQLALAHASAAGAPVVEPNDEIERLTAEKKDMAEKISTIANDMKALRDEFQAKVEECSVLSEENNVLGKRLQIIEAAQATGGDADQTAARLREENIQLSLDVKELASKLDAVKVDFVALEEERDSLQEQLAANGSGGDLMTIVQDLQKMLKQKDEEISVLSQSKGADMSISLDGTPTNERGPGACEGCKDLQNDLDDIAVVASERGKLLEELKKRIAVLEEENKAAKEASNIADDSHIELQRVQLELTQLKERSSNEVEQLTVECASEKEKRHRIEDELALIKVRMMEMENQGADNDNTYKISAELYSRMNEDVAKWKELCSSKDKEISLLRVELNRKVQEASRLELEADIKEQDINNLTAKVQRALADKGRALDETRKKKGKGDGTETPVTEEPAPPEAEREDSVSLLEASAVRCTCGHPYSDLHEHWTPVSAGNGVMGAFFLKLFQATVKSDDMLVKHLIDEMEDTGTEVVLTTIRDVHGYTPLHAAVKDGNERIIDLLLQKLASPNVVSFHRGDVGAEDIWECPLHLAVELNKPRIAKTLLLYGAQVNFQMGPGKETPLHMAARLGRPEMIRVLMEHGASMHAENAASRTPEQEASVSGNHQIVKLMNDYTEESLQERLRARIKGFGADGR